MPKTHCPRLIFIRHGQTDWSLSGKHTSFSNLDLTNFGELQMEKTGELLIGEHESQMIKPQNIVQIFSSPRLRARHTTQLLLKAIPPEIRSKIPVEYDEDITEWNYGQYEGLTTAEIRKSRHDRGIDPPDHDWSIWSDGCEGGENYKKVTTRLDRFIQKVRSIHVKALNDGQPCDIIVVGHGHILRSLVARWVSREINTDPALMLDAGGVGVLSYQHHNIDEPSIYLAGAFRVPVEQKGADV
ncbi:uncharacterized protein KGF55_000731 [Candida pseudojiufengensis]|uniref:uncharacterized protein n=1 Tax=Candida pseudojiufengensis TaxID=497109 RepID=UPI0022242957|nr:uncharacterized protein KGF55_000731 [Candida pseudojiufengensis]KAI5966422.1 hypothetical protein KGF55_000731 [Candida pseudojiufengensis]